MPTEVISLVIAFVGVCIAFAGSLGNARKDSERAAGRISEVIAKLDFISDDLKEMKADYRSVTRELQDVRDIAVRAKASADSAHKRLDSAGIEHAHE
jgi:outer membrane murein-binding lipoprotein Lpp